MYLKNTGATATWAGQEIVASAYYPVPTDEETKFAIDSATLTSIGDGGLVVAASNDGTGDLGVVDGITLLLGESSKAVHISDPFVDNLTDYSFAGKGGTSTLSTGSNDVDVLIHATEILCISGAEAWTDAATHGDKLTFQVIDIDNVLELGANTVLDEFGTNWQIHATAVTKAFPGYIAAIPAGVYVRMKVTAAAACEFYYNLHLHEK